MDFMRRNAKWIALAALLAMLAPVIAQLFNTLFAVDTLLVAVILLAAIVIGFAVMARSSRDEE
ncbi:hypothetical protein [Glycomyces algeriensis]|jgi:multisubunit Na+/H+ antiporter MnhC subunit|uniref:Uncharacterized protein n=1 Tax=Glycomyces algeriensis TaxID=256037 RepID=A0A9W6LI65_9ACTN|nr:hypothetical protein [Glycomyces algeriensis]MDA1368847.1 hypothetical protein [Glycomyces algeriensis]MDR7350863.1 multisubunit Na+/H+ antiporter MnhC subunit [Glycomyces algeriensis]GLI43574.1 hypothetical protein GALLR39Z86_34240 [Glycomyces algeriensis]